MIGAPTHSEQGALAWKEEMNQESRTSPSPVISVLCSLLLAGGALLLSGCATIISGTSQAITIDSNVKGATVKVEGNVVGVTPFTGKIPRKKESVAMLSKDGYIAQPMTLTTTYNPVTVLSVLWDFSTTDCLTGACWEYAPNSYYVELKREGEDAALFDQRAFLKALGMTYYADFRTEIAAGGGPLTQSLNSRHAPWLSLDEVLQLISALPDDNPVAFGDALARALQESV